MEDLHQQVVRRRDERLKRWGARSWNLVGIAAAVCIGYFGLAAISGLVVLVF